MTIVVEAGPGMAEDCRFLMRDPLNLRGWQVFYRLRGTDGWTSLDRIQPDFSRQSVEFAQSNSPM